MGTRADTVATIDVVVEGSGLKLQAAYEEPFVLLPVATDRFRVEGTSSTYVEFVVTDEDMTRGRLVSDVYEPFEFVRMPEGIR